MPIFLAVDLEGAGDLATTMGLGRRYRVAAMQYANYQVAKLWHRRYLKKHFTSHSRNKYGYQRRKRKYSRIKVDMAAGVPYRDPRTGEEEIERVVKGGRADIAHSGETEQKARSGSSIRTTAAGFTLRVRVPDYITRRQRGTKSQPNMKKEIERTTPEEAEELAKIWWAAYRRFLNTQARIKQRGR